MAGYNNVCRKVQPPVVTDFMIAGIRVVIRQGVVSHILQGHEKDFRFAVRGANTPFEKEQAVAPYIKDMVVGAAELYVTDEGRTKQGSLLVHLRRPIDRMFHRLIVTHEQGNRYRLETAYKLQMDAVTLGGFSGRLLVQYSHGMQVVLTAARMDAANPDIARVHGYEVVYV
ncbi:hypothetical protein CRE_25838 [Caenorhabditis remanei]|uniref:Uncharacterized protein n=1 Tax=Caenorhabditis remanei TaxID=31234 RepID=E3NA90_CAERE|nr:hypothetical protein CRE_25838 [Caenorhabditis remanei]